MKNFTLLFFFFVFSINCFSQKLSLDIYGGVTNYQGDLQDKQFTFSQSHLAGGLGLSYNITDHFAIRSAFTLGKVSADDKFTKNKIRNLNFTSGISEFQLGLQYNLFSLESMAFSPYLFVSAAVFHFNPYTFDGNGDKYYLQPLSTEGQGFIDGRQKYELTQFAIPIGAGIKFALSENINIGVEFGFRKLYTDYLDDVSTAYVDKNLLELNRGPKAVELAYRGGEIKPNPPYPKDGETRGHSPKDWYYITAFTLSYRFTEGSSGGGRNGFSGGNRGKRSNFGCPKNIM
ncbi:MAG: DUF6089 family protein [Ginsengibacter sp.]